MEKEEEQRYSPEIPPPPPEMAAEVFDEQIRDTMGSLTDEQALMSIAVTFGLRLGAYMSRLNDELYNEVKDERYRKFLRESLAPHIGTIAAAMALVARNSCCQKHCYANWQQIFTEAPKAVDIISNGWDQILKVANSKEAGMSTTSDGSTLFISPQPPDNPDDK